jgi:hypothetical protein
MKEGLFATEAIVPVIAQEGSAEKKGARRPGTTGTRRRRRRRRSAVEGDDALAQTAGGG